MYCTYFYVLKHSKYVLTFPIVIGNMYAASYGIQTEVPYLPQIVGSICEFVEVNTAEIRSGWRPLFGALRSVRVQGARPPPAAPQEPRPAHLRIVLDVFEAFLSTDNVLVFSNAAVDCILCLLKHVRGPSECRAPPAVSAVCSDGTRQSACVLTWGVWLGTPSVPPAL